MAKLKEVSLTAKATVKTKTGGFISGEVVAKYDIEEETTIEQLTEEHKQDIIDSVSELLGSVGNMVGA